MKMCRVFIMFFMIFCLGFTSVFSVLNTVYAEIRPNDEQSEAGLKITSNKQAEEKALKRVKDATIVVTAVSGDKLYYQVDLEKGTKEYSLLYYASDGKLHYYGWEKNNVSRKSTKKIMSKNKCKKLAKKKVKKGIITKVIKKCDDGMDIYKVYMKKSNKKFELKFHARTGKLIEYSWILVATNK
ncbi:MAG: hypothetical protein K2N51_02775 [Lachnospiraceae bacterium]|nr:hypothetical protein [Lachnospiraceae bacterium]